MKNYHINISVRVISLAFGSAENSYLDIDNFAYYKNLIHLNMMSTVLLFAFRINFFLFIFLCESYIVWACRSVRNKLAMKQPVKTFLVQYRQYSNWCLLKWILICMVTYQLVPYDFCHASLVFFLSSVNQRKRQWLLVNWYKKLRFYYYLQAHMRFKK